MEINGLVEEKGSKGQGSSPTFISNTGSSLVNKVEDTEDSKPKDGRR